MAQRSRKLWTQVASRSNMVASELRRLFTKFRWMFGVLRFSKIWIIDASMYYVNIIFEEVSNKVETVMRQLSQ